MVEIEKPEPVVVGEEAEAEVAEVAEDLIRPCASGQVVAGWFDIDDAALRALAGQRLRLPA